MSKLRLYEVKVKVFIEHYQPKTFTGLVKAKSPKKAEEAAKFFLNEQIKNISKMELIRNKSIFHHFILNAEKL